MNISIGLSITRSTINKRFKEYALKQGYDMATDIRKPGFSRGSYGSSRTRAAYQCFSDAIECIGLKIIEDTEPKTLDTEHNVVLCNVDCEYLSPTEAEQNAGGDKKRHICKLYHTAVYHTGKQDGVNHHPHIVKCEDCMDDYRKTIGKGLK